MSVQAILTSSRLKRQRLSRLALPPPASSFRGVTVTTPPLLNITSAALALWAVEESPLSSLDEEILALAEDELPAEGAAPAALSQSSVAPYKRKTPDTQSLRRSPRLAPTVRASGIQGVDIPSPPEVQVVSSGPSSAAPPIALTPTPPMPSVPSPVPATLSSALPVPPPVLSVVPPPTPPIAPPFILSVVSPSAPATATTCPLDQFNLTSDGNPIAHLAQGREAELLQARLTPESPNVDWRIGKDGTPAYKNVATTKYRIVGSLGQRVGYTAPEGEECVACQKGYGPFKSCRIARTKDAAASLGACMNCAFGGSGATCSFRIDQPDWVRDYFVQFFPGFTFVPGSARKSRSKGKGHSEPVRETTAQSAPATPAGPTASAAPVAGPAAVPTAAAVTAPVSVVTTTPAGGPASVSSVAPVTALRLPRLPSPPRPPLLPALSRPA
ncbi:uncharacterized protein N7482_010696 [Penicillium canariense]|uniref:Uncharacterized protein n=1 Tax=Penicillium canariense TaxID=189055 RepID=A0A9W9HM30_9EURO|nr:uncharacterized protein N7482_010696 [Penicillium canariense]KAJ5151444.1 hypothetical protein N7482_010696 [Penicillium canariense]